MTPEKPGNRMAGEVHNEMLVAIGWKPEVDLQDYIKENL
jgi:hypothetical protein